MVLEDFRLRIFATVAETGSFTKAAARLGISQPAVSQNIAELEKNLDVQLFVRSRGEAVLTDSGRTFAKYADEILKWYAAAGAMFAPGGRESSDKPVAIASDAFIASYVLPACLMEILSVLPSNFIIKTYDFGSMPESTDADISISASFRRHSAGYDGSLAGVVPAVLFTGAECSSWTSLAVWSPYYPELSPEFAAKVCLDSDAVGTVISLVSMSSGIAGIAPLCCVRDNPSLRIIPEPLPHLRLDVVCKTTKESAGTRLCELLRENIGKSLI